MNSSVNVRNRILKQILHWKRLYLLKKNFWQD